MVKRIILTLILTLTLCTPIYASDYKIGLRGMDVSQYQGTIDWDKVAQDDIHYAFVRCKSAVSGVDINFDYNMQNANRVGIPVGVYYYAGATTDEEVIAEANYILNAVSPYVVSLPLVYDIEGDQAKLGKDRLVRNATIFCEYVRAKGYNPMIYASKNFIVNYFTDLDYPVWEACYRSSCEYYNDNIKYWQYTSKGKVNGINGRVDLNYRLSPLTNILTYSTKGE